MGAKGASGPFQGSGGAGGGKNPCRSRRRARFPCVRFFVLIFTGQVIEVGTGGLTSPYLTPNRGGEAQVLHAHS